MRDGSPASSSLLAILCVEHHEVRPDLGSLYWWSISDNMWEVVVERLGDGSRLKDVVDHS